VVRRIVGGGDISQEEDWDDILVDLRLRFMGKFVGEVLAGGYVASHQLLGLLSLLIIIIVGRLAH